MMESFSREFGRESYLGSFYFICHTNVLIAVNLPKWFIKAVNKIR